MALLLSAIVPVVEIVSAVLLIGSFPFQESSSLMLHHDALFEFCVVILATVSSVKWDFESVKLLLPMGLRLVNIIRL